MQYCGLVQYEQHVDYDFDLSMGVLFAEGRIVFYNGNVLEFTESITPDRLSIDIST